MAEANKKRKYQNTLFLTTQRHPEEMELLNQFAEAEGLPLTPAVIRLFHDVIPDIISGKLTIKRRSRGGTAS